jgi:hypothetical protein
MGLSIDGIKWDLPVQPLPHKDCEDESVGTLYQELIELSYNIYLDIFKKELEAHGNDD